MPKLTKYSPHTARGEAISQIWIGVLTFWIIFLFVGATATAMQIAFPLASLVQFWLISLMIGMTATGLTILLTKE